MVKFTKKISNSVNAQEQAEVISNSVRKYVQAMENVAEDTFESAAKHRERLASEIEGVQFVAKKIQYAPEDLKKMETMTKDERKEYMLQLRLQGKFTYVDDVKD